MQRGVDAGHSSGHGSSAFDGCGTVLGTVKGPKGRGELGELRRPPARVDGETRKVALLVIARPHLPLRVAGRKTADPDRMAAPGEPVTQFGRVPSDSCGSGPQEMR
jgi:hypothetical protein